MRKILTILLENESGALSRVIGLFSQRGYNIESLNVAPTNDPTISLVTIQTIDNKKIVEQIEKQLHKLINVLKVVNLGQELHVSRELLLLKIKYNRKIKESILNITNIFKGKIIYINTSFFIIQLSGKTSKINNFLKLIKDFSNIIEISRSGIIGISCL